MDKVQKLSNPECDAPSPETLEFTASPLLSSSLHFKDKRTKLISNVNYLRVI
jgi:hypothetical protein